MNTSKYNPHGLHRPFVGARQFAALRYVARRQTSPTRAEIGRHLGIRRETAHLLLDKLIAAGLVSRIPGAWRNVYPTVAGLALLNSGLPEEAR